MTWFKNEEQRNKSRTRELENRKWNEKTKKKRVKTRKRLDICEAEAGDWSKGSKKKSEENRGEAERKNTKKMYARRKRLGARAASLNRW